MATVERAMVRAGRRARALIAVTRSVSGGWTMTQFNRLAVWRAGGRAVVVDASRTFDAGSFDGLVIGGGEDIAAELGGAGFAPTLAIDHERDRLELDLLRVARDRHLPVLGICRGAQMINVHRGGTLHADIFERYAEARRLRTVLPRKHVTIKSGSRLARILGSARAHVNALHHQAVDRLGARLAVAAEDADGVVQAIEDTDAEFCIGVQWHPEFLLSRRRQQRLFDELVAAAGRGSWREGRRRRAGAEA